MMSQVCFIMVVTLSAFVPFMGSLIQMGAVLFLLSVMSALCLSFLSGSWYGFAMFLMYITGLLVLFGYMLVVNPNSATKMKFKFFILTSFLVGGFSVPFVRLNLSTKSYSNSFSLQVLEIYENPNLPVYLLMVCLLFVALILAVYLSYKTPKPMRSFL